MHVQRCNKKMDIKNWKILVDGTMMVIPVEGKGRGEARGSGSCAFVWFFEWSRNILVPGARGKIKREEREGESALEP